MPPLAGIAAGVGSAAAAIGSAIASGVGTAGAAIGSALGSAGSAIGSAASAAGSSLVGALGGGATAAGAAAPATGSGLLSAAGGAAGSVAPAAASAAAPAATGGLLAAGSTAPSAVSAAAPASTSLMSGVSQGGAGLAGPLTAEGGMGPMLNAAQPAVDISGFTPNPGGMLPEGVTAGPGHAPTTWLGKMRENPWARAGARMLEGMGKTSGDDSAVPPAGGGGASFPSFPAGPAPEHYRSGHVTAQQDFAKNIMDEYLAAGGAFYG